MNTINRINANIYQRQLRRQATTVQPVNKAENWPFPGHNGPTPWTKAMEKAYQDQQRKQIPAAPF